MSDFDEVYRRLNLLETGSARIEVEVREARNDIKDMTDKLNKSIEGQNKILHGNGKAGVFTRIDRLEQWTNHIKAIWAGVCFLASKLVYDWIQGK